jgi:serine protease inhibitor
MMNRISGPVLLACAISFMLSLSSCENNNLKDKQDNPGEPVNIATEVYQKEVIDSANSFAFDLFRPMLAGQKSSGNIMISPFSVSSALSMTLNGAAGETFEAMLSALRLDGKEIGQINETYLKLMSEMVGVDERVILEVANSVWVEKHLQVRQPFMDDLRTWYKAEARSFDANDPGAVTEVNNWIAGKTHDKIKDMLDGFDDGVAMLLINAVYFNGKWKYRFDEGDTKDGPFFPSSATPENVPMMHQDQDLKTASIDGFTLVDLPYGQGNFSMLVALPDEGMPAAELTGKINQARWNAWLEQLGTNIHSVELSMPRFKFGYKKLLNEDLINLGMGVAFTGAADFSKISDQGLMITSVLHQSFIETSEEGTEAAAATVVEMGTTSVNPESNRKIDINRPFLFFIHENSTGTILFMGKVADPLQ